MISYIKGVLTIKSESSVVVETGGIGYEIFVPTNSTIYRAVEGDEVILYTFMKVSEDDISLYGFSDKESLKLFRLLITVSGVGAKGAMAILSCGTINDLQSAIAFEDANFLTKAQGIGKKSAQRIVLELKDKVGNIQGTDVTAADISDNDGPQDAKGEALTALVALGYSRTEAQQALSGITDTGLTSEEYIKKALRKLF